MVNLKKDGVYINGHWSNLIYIKLPVSYNPGQKSWTLGTFAKIWSFCPPPPSHPQHNVDVHSSKVDPVFQHCFRGKLNNDFPFPNNGSPVGILSSMPRTFGQDCLCSVSAL